MPAKLLVIGMDAAEATLIEAWAAQGHLPTFRRLQEQGVTYRLDNCMETLPAAIWSEINTGLSCGKMPHYYLFDQLRTGDARARPVTPDEVDPEDFYWTIASRAGKRVAVVDSIHCPSAKNFNGVQLLQWGVHERNFPLISDPPDLVDDLHAKHGGFPIENCDTFHGFKVEGYKELLEGLEEGVRRRTALILDLLDREDWDLFTCLYGEPHCVGHQFWGFLDPSITDYIADVPRDLKDAMQTVYTAIDHGIAAILEAAGPDTQVIVFASHGMGPYVGGYHLLPEILLRLGMSETLPAKAEGGAKARAAEMFRGFQTWFGRLPGPIKAPFKALGRVVPGYGRMRDTIGHGSDPLASPHTKAAAFRSNRCGAIRLSLAGREPNGCVQPGAEADALIAELRQELGALVDPVSGQPIIARTATANEAFGEDYHPNTPDLMILFNENIGRIDECYSDRVGHIRIPNGPPHNPRSGDHTAESRLWMLGPGIIPTDAPSTGNVLDLAPTVLSLLDVAVPPALDGSPLRA